MSVPVILLIVLFVLMVAVGGKRGAKSFFTVLLNFITFAALLKFMAIGFDPVKVTVVGCIIISSVTLFYINGFNKKTKAALVSVTIVVFLTILLAIGMGTSAKMQGFGWEQAESVAYLSMYVRLDFARVVICEIVLGLIGAIIDVAISISSALNEIYRMNPSIGRKALFQSGMNIGKDMLGTMTNTLLFAYIGGFLALIFWFHVLKYSIGDVINAKVFCSEVFGILTSGIGIILIIPVSAFITPVFLLFQSPLKKKPAVVDLAVSQFPHSDGKNPEEN
jgi:uncharacterized membrane protein